MPIYIYECQDCGQKQEHYARSVSDNLKACQDPDCGGKDLKKCLTTASPHFKGGGWFKDGYSKGPPEPDRGAKEAKIRQEIREGHKARVKEHDAKAASLGLKRVGDFEEVKLYPDKPIE